ncbi:MAG: tetratricopeptide repeat protein [Thaumarchaeota archaeon]|nr:tetratricopeptide repeat protein [Nitrososphaerota archaeon]
MNEILEFIDKGKDFLENGQYEDALRCFEQAIIMNPNDPDLWNFKAVVLRSIGRHEEAIECFNKSLKIDPRDKNAS